MLCDMHVGMCLNSFQPFAQCASRAKHVRDESDQPLTIVTVASEGTAQNTFITTLTFVFFTTAKRMLNFGCRHPGTRRLHHTSTFCAVLAVTVMCKIAVMLQ